MSELNVAVKSMSRNDIRSITYSMRKVTDVAEYPYYCVAHWLECLFLPLIGFEFEVREADFMGLNHGLTDHGDKVVYIREDVYEGACTGMGRDRMTMIHEAGHCFLHSPERVVYARSFQKDIPTYQDPEWQAKAFAGEFLVPADLLRHGMCVDDVINDFGVSEEAARFQLKVYERDGLIRINGSTIMIDP